MGVSLARIAFDRPCLFWVDKLASEVRFSKLTNSKKQGLSTPIYAKLTNGRRGQTLNQSPKDSQIDIVLIVFLSS